MNRPLAVLAVYLAGASMSALAAVYELPGDGAAVTAARIRITKI